MLKNDAEIELVEEIEKVFRELSKEEVEDMAKRYIRQKIKHNMRNRKYYHNVKEKTSK